MVRSPGIFIGLTAVGTWSLTARPSHRSSLTSHFDDSADGDPDGDCGATVPGPGDSATVAVELGARPIATAGSCIGESVSGEVLLGSTEATISGSGRGGSAAGAE